MDRSMVGSRSANLLSKSGSTREGWIDGQGRRLCLLLRPRVWSERRNARTLRPSNSGSASDCGIVGSVLLSRPVSANQRNALETMRLEANELPHSWDRQRLRFSKGASCWKRGSRRWCASCQWLAHDYQESPAHSKIAPMTILFPQQRRFKGLQWRPLRASHWRGMRPCLFSHQFSCRWPRRGDAEHIAQLFAVTSNHDNFLAAREAPT